MYCGVAMLKQEVDKHKQSIIYGQVSLQWSRQVSTYFWQRSVSLTYVPLILSPFAFVCLSVCLSAVKMAELLAIKRELTVIKVQIDGLLDCVDKMDGQRKDCSGRDNKQPDSFLSVTTFSCHLC